MKKNIVITLNDHYLEEIDNTLSNLRKEGMIIKNVYEFGVISGVLEEENFSKIRALDEVLLLKEDKNINIPPPSGGIQ
ncbi:hypothetical protein SAMN05444483_11174 [Salegentibacter echinorum]|uniref:Uncharacterized protein n=1 Tax=Salegentibacter echinorum TaxID=1073325 RepID=A0A1M5JMJ2_SALEC|nr:hypothetical protein [Salegentibacter echinorum]SHG41479.1 hypothetical protein SAMN05444483_11174 [Salegentibacter echinorum]